MILKPTRFPLARPLQKPPHITANMNTSLKLLSLFATAAVPGALAAELSGLHLPAGIDAFTVFCAFAATWVVTTFVADYGRRPRPLAADAAVAAPAKAAHPLAA